jgi:DNA-binding MarR family transcriptional regulator
LFADREECLLAALDDAFERIDAVVVPAYEREGSWRERVRAALVELLGLFDEDPGLGRLVVVESLAAGPRALVLRDRVLARLVAAVDEGRALTGIPKGHAASVQGGASTEASVLTAEGVVGAVSSILYTRLAGGKRTGEEHEPLLELTGPLMGMIVLPYLGKAAARRELARPAPPVRATLVRSGAGYPFRDLGMRLTYRTLRVLDAVARYPDASNRQAGEVAGIADQGQVSKLLSRLERLGLLENVAGTAGKGAPNAWRLTEKGRAMQQAVQSPRGGAHDRTTSRRGWVS